MKEYHALLTNVLENGTTKTDRTGTGTISLFGTQIRFDLSKGFPLLTTKKMAFKSIVSELLWFIEGSNNEHRLKEILYGDKRSTKKTIWGGNANASYWKPKFDGDVGNIYGVQWRKWATNRKKWTSSSDYEYEFIDQLAELINNIKTDPYSRRHIINAWNVAELKNMCLPPCHVMSQFNVTDGKLSCHMYQRSQDLFLGAPFNYASYALLTHMIAQLCNLDVGELIVSAGDCHIYLNHIDQVKEQLSRDCLTLPSINLNTKINSIDDFTMDDIKIIDYQYHPEIKAQMAL